MGCAAPGRDRRREHRRRLESAWTHPQVLRDAGDSPLDESGDRRRGAQLGIGDEPRLVQIDYLPSNLELAGLRGEDVLDPLHVRPVGQEEEVCIATTEDVYRGVVDPSALASSVRHDAEARKLRDDREQYRIDVARGDTLEGPHAGTRERSGLAVAHGSAVLGRKING